MREGLLICYSLTWSPMLLLLVHSMTQPYSTMCAMCCEGWLGAF
jgi:hypothetical protein